MPKSPEAKVTIAALAREFGVSTRTLRFYESEKLIRPSRVGRRRLYCEDTRQRLAFILCGKRLGLTIAEIRELVALCEWRAGDSRKGIEALEQIRRHRLSLEQKSLDIEAIQAELDRVEAGCHARHERPDEEEKRRGTR